MSWVHEGILFRMNQIRLGQVVKNIFKSERGLSVKLNFFLFAGETKVYNTVICLALLYFLLLVLLQAFPKDFFFGSFLGRVPEHEVHKAFCCYWAYAKVIAELPVR